MRQEKGVHAWPRAFVLVAVMCVALLAVLTVVQVAHIHRIGTDADNCPICTVLHAVTPMSVAAAVIILVQLGRQVSVAQTVRPSRKRPLVLLNRPPPFSL
jgi:hypothetical protein